MARRTIQELLDRLGYLIGYAPDEFPKEDQTSLDAEFGRVAQLLEDLQEEIPAAWRRDLIRSAEDELRAASVAYRTDDTKAGDAALRRAESCLLRSRARAAPQPPGDDSTGS